MKLTDKNGKLVYEKDFANLSYHFETSDANHNALPLNAAVIAKMIVPAIETIVADISPHKEQRDLVVNEDGDKKAVLLLKAQAFHEAYLRLQKLLKDKNVKVADYENLGILFEIIGDYTRAKENFKKALDISPNSPIASAGKNRIEKIQKNEKVLKKMKAKKLQKKPELSYKKGDTRNKIKTSKNNVSSKKTNKKNK